MEKIEREVRQTARGRDESTPFKALFGVWLVIAGVAGLFIAVGLLLWVLLR